MAKLQLRTAGFSEDKTIFEKPISHAAFKRSELSQILLRLLQGDIEEISQLSSDGTVPLEQLLALAGIHLVDGQAASNLLGLSGAEDERRQLLEATRFVQAAVAVNMRLKAELFRVGDVLRAAEVPFLLIKGFAIDRSPLRVMNDIDVLIHPIDLERCVNSLLASGYRFMGSEVMSENERRQPMLSSHWNNQFQFISPAYPVSVEIHISPFETQNIRLENLGRLNSDAAPFWQHSSMVAELGCPIPRIEVSLALLCVHATTKRSAAHNTFILRHALDIFRILDSGMDSKTFVQLCRRWEIAYYAYTAISVSAKALERPAAPEFVDSLRGDLTPAQRLLSNVHIKCYRDLFDASRWYRFLYAVFMPWAIGGGFRKSLQWYVRLAFPPRWQQEQRYGVSRSSPAFVLSYVYGPFLRLFSRQKGRFQDKYR